MTDTLTLHVHRWAHACSSVARPRPFLPVSVAHATLHAGYLCLLIFVAPSLISVLLVHLSPDLRLLETRPIQPSQFGPCPAAAGVPAPSSSCILGSHKPEGDAGAVMETRRRGLRAML